MDAITNREWEIHRVALIWFSLHFFNLNLLLLSVSPFLQKNCRLNLVRIIVEFKSKFSCIADVSHHDNDVYNLFLVIIVTFSRYYLQLIFYTIPIMSAFVCMLTIISQALLPPKFRSFDLHNAFIKVSSLLLNWLSSSKGVVFHWWAISKATRMWLKNMLLDSLSR